jgi:hypothetical protein
MASELSIMTRKTVVPDIQEKGDGTIGLPVISLTLSRTDPGQLQVEVGITEFISYSQCPGFTRLNLTGRKVLEVKEKTDQIDRLVRKAS